MKKTIFIQTDENIISTAELEIYPDVMGGIILVHDETKLIGSVIYSSKLMCWLLETFYDRTSYNSLSELLHAFPKYKFVYVEE